MSLARIVLRNHCRRVAAAEMDRTRYTGQRRGTRLLFKAAWITVGVPSVRWAVMKIYGQRLDFFKERVYKFLRFGHQYGLGIYGDPTEKYVLHRPWAGSRF